jgi:hypothetical protein
VPTHDAPILRYFETTVAKAIEKQPTGCILWPYNKVRGYGRVYIKRKMYRVHSLSLERLTGKKPRKHVLHSCDSPSCFNPWHLREGTHAENMADMASKKRGAKHQGERNPRAKLSAAQVAIIRTSDLSAPMLASIYGVTVTHINTIKRGEAWSVN